jgi:hypothetical protein
MAISITPDWRLADIGNQWVLERRRPKGWRPIRYHCDREALIGISVRELIPEATEAALSKLRALPRWHGMKSKRGGPKSAHTDARMGEGVSEGGQAESGSVHLARAA